MYRVTATRFETLMRHAGNLTLTRRASSSVVAAKSTSGGLLSRFTEGSVSTLPPLDIPLNSIQLPPSLPDHIEPGKKQITTLPNGIKIASETSFNPVASIGLYINSGSMYETPGSFGATHILGNMAFKSTTNRSHLRIAREVEAIGGYVSACAQKEHTGYTYDALKTYLPQMVELLVDCVRNQAFLDWEVNEQIENVKALIEYSSIEEFLLEAICSAGYTGPFSNPIHASNASFSKLNNTILQDFVAANYTAPRMVLAATGVEHEELLKYAEPLLFDLPGGPQVEVPKSVYVGGDHRAVADTGGTTFALAFELPGGWLKEKDAEKEAMTLAVLETLMKGGGSSSAGGSENGVHSRPYLKVLNEYSEVHSFSAFQDVYNHTAIFGIQATTESDFVPKAIDIAAKELIAVATNGEGINQVQLDRTKKSTKSIMLTENDSSMNGSEILIYGEWKSLECFLKAIDEVTANDITSIAKKLLSSPLTMVSRGDVTNVPTYDSVSCKFQ